MYILLCFCHVEAMFSGADVGEENMVAEQMNNI